MIMVSASSKLIVIALLVCSCSSAPKKSEPSSDEKTVETQTSLLKKLNLRIQEMEAQLTGLNAKIDAARSRLDSMSGIDSGQRVEDLRTESSMVSDTNREKSMLGLLNDNSVKAFRKGMIFYEAKNYPDSVLEFSNFIEKYPDHPLAGSAQFYIAESYYFQSEFKLARDEYEQVLKIYDRSPHVATTLLRLSTVENKLNRGEIADRHKMLLLSLFPNSPAAKGVKIAEKAKQ